MKFLGYATTILSTYNGAYFLPILETIRKKNKITSQEISNISKHKIYSTEQNVINPKKMN